MTLDQLPAPTRRRLLKRATTPTLRARLDMRLAGNCKSAAGRVRPLVDAAKCEGKEDCVLVCPFGVFEIGRVADPVYRAQSAFVRFKMRVHGMKTAHTPNADGCRNCGLCVEACPEQAISLTTLAATG